MDKLFYHKKRLKSTFKEIILYTSAAVILTAPPALSVHAAQTDSQTPTQQESQPASDTTPSAQTAIPETPADASTATAPIPADAAADTLNAAQTPADIPAESIDAAAVTLQPEPAPADQGAFDVTPMQSTVYAASSKGLNVRSGPSTNHSKLGTLQYGQEITVTGKTADNWYQIQYSGGVGYVLADYVSTTPPASTQNPVAENPAQEAPETSPASSTPAAESPDSAPSDEPQTEDSSSPSEQGSTAVTSPLIGTPIIVALAAATIGIIALIIYSVYSFFRKDNDTAEEYDEDDEYYENEPYADDEYYEDNEQYPDDEYYEDDGQYPDDEYYEDDEQYPDDEYYEDDDQYPNNRSDQDDNRRR